MPEKTLLETLAGVPDPRRQRASPPAGHPSLVDRDGALGRDRRVVDQGWFEGVDELGAVLRPGIRRPHTAQIGRLERVRNVVGDVSSKLTLLVTRFPAAVANAEALFGLVRGALGH